MKTPFRILVRGGGFDKRMSNAKAADALKEQAQVVLTREPDNKFDSNAITVHVLARVSDNIEQSFPLGYVAKELASILAPLMDEGARWDCVLISWTHTTCEVEARDANIGSGG